MSSCVKHPMAVASEICGRCGHDFCDECVVYPHGMDRPPMCIACALELGGVRRRGADRPPKLSRRAVKRRLREHRAEKVRAVTADPEPQGEPSYEEEKWMQGIGTAEDFPGGWQRRF